MENSMTSYAQYLRIKMLSLFCCNILSENQIFFREIFHLLIIKLKRNSN